MSSDFHFLVPESFHKNLDQIGTVVSEKTQFEFLYVHDLGPRSRNDLDLQYSHTFIYSIRCLLLPRFLKGFTICGHGGHLGHRTSIMSSYFHFLVPESFNKKFGSNWQSGF